MDSRASRMTPPRAVAHDDPPAKYWYQPLKEGYIRTATIHPGGLDDRIVISVQMVKFDELNTPQYEALSYVWGSPDNAETILVQVGDERGSHATLSVTQNLACALRHLRLVDQPHTMWIDAICIDQSNEVEKGQQVAVMSEIFRRALRVIAWLGPEQDGSSQALEPLFSFGSQLDYDWNKKQLMPSTTSTNPSLAKTHIPSPFSRKTMSSIYSLLCREWFERLWIRQEIFPANSQAVVMCGSRQIPWLSFRHAIMGIYLKGCYVFPEFDEYWKRMIYLKDVIWQARELSLLELREETSSAKCADPRDRVFAILGLLGDCDKALGITPDYTKTTAQVYEDVALRFFSRCGNDILCQCQYSGFAAQGPSWVPDWSTPSVVFSRFWTTHASSQVQVRADTRRSGILKVAGVSCAVIERVEPTQIHSTHRYSDVWAKLQHVFSRLGLDHAHLMGSSMIDAYAQTIIGGDFGDAFQPPKRSHPDLEGGRAVLRMIISPDSMYTDYIHSFPEGSSTKEYLHRIGLWAPGRALFTGDGYCGYAPAAAQHGDEICVVIGCKSPMALRPLANGRYSVIGECFVPGISLGEALLGALPPKVRYVETTIPTENRALVCRIFLDTETGSSSFEDPRLSHLGMNLEEFRQRLQQDPGAVLEVDAEVLRKRGANITYFDLV